MAETKNALLDL